MSELNNKIKGFLQSEKYGTRLQKAYEKGFGGMDGYDSWRENIGLALQKAESIGVAGRTANTLSYLAHQKMFIGEGGHAVLINNKGAITISLTVAGVRALARKQLAYVGEPQFVVDSEVKSGNFTLENITKDGRLVAVLTHKIDPFRSVSRESVAGVYLPFRKHGSTDIEYIFLSKAEIDHLFDSARQKAVWKAHFTEMAKTRTFRRLLKTLDLSQTSKIDLQVQGDEHYPELEEIVDGEEAPPEDPEEPASEPETDDEPQPNYNVDTGEIVDENEETNAIPNEGGVEDWEQEGI